MAVTIELDITDNHFSPLSTAENGNMPVLPLGIERGDSRMGHVAYIIQQEIPNPCHGIHMRTPR